MDWTKEIDKLILASDKNYLLTVNELWVSGDIYRELDVQKYKGFSIYTSSLMSEQTMILGNMYW